MRRGLKQFPLVAVFPSTPAAARAAPYEKGTETNVSGEWDAGNRVAARAAPYEKGTETRQPRLLPLERTAAARAAPYEKGTETMWSNAVATADIPPRARPPMRRGLKPGISAVPHRAV